ncbi:hypothetical protein Q7O_003682 [Pectobacterium carotovorum subsp. carotovorum PCCS1]|nr:hypothetical protein [Pectobacterium carotovorum subsp. carotovorum PCCS1]
MSGQDGLHTFRRDALINIFHVRYFVKVDCDLIKKVKNQH